MWHYLAAVDCVSEFIVSRERIELSNSLACKLMSESVGPTDWFLVEPSVRPLPGNLGSSDDYKQIHPHKFNGILEQSKCSP